MEVYVFCLEKPYFFSYLRIYFLKVNETFPDDTKKRRGLRVSGLIEWYLFMDIVAHCGSTFGIIPCSGRRWLLSLLRLELMQGA
jgi:hypothetical protein